MGDATVFWGCGITPLAVLRPYGGRFSFILLNTERMYLKMKKTISALSLLLVLLLAFTACGGDPNDPWNDATHTKDTTLGSGSKAVTVEVVVGEHSVTFTLMTDAEILGDALLETGLCEGEEGPYGLYIKTTNGILADYDVNGHYWAFYIDGAYALTGVDSTTITDGASYKLAYE